MDIKKLQKTIITALEDVKAQDIQVYDTEHLSALFERVIVATGSSNRQTKSLAASVRDAVKEQGLMPRVEGEENGEWIVVDCNSAVVHIMQPGIRQYYHLEELWGERPVKWAAAKAARKGLVKAEEPVAAKAAAKKAPAKTAAKKVAAKKVATPKSAEPKLSAPAAAPEKAPAKKPAAKKVAVKKTSTDTAPAKKTVAAKAPASKKTVAAKAPAKKAPAKKAAAQKPAAKA